MPHLQTHSVCRTVLRLALLLLVPFPIALGGEDEKAFALYAEVQKDAPGAVAFSFQSAFTKERVAGFYVAPPILTRAHVNAAEWAYREAGAQPWPTLRLRFTARGRQLLHDYIKANATVALVLLIDGHVYTTVAPEDIRDISKDGGALLIYLNRTPDEREELKRLVGILKPTSKPQKR
jgi:hypothetical protein